jgi:signal transduction histidine kinase
MRLNLRAKVTLTISLFLVAVFGVVMYLTLSRNADQLRSSINEQSKSFASLATSPIGNTFVLYQDSGSIKITQQVNQFLALDPDVSAVRIVSVDGSQVYDSQGKSHSPLQADLAGTFKPRYITNKGGYVQQIVQPFFEDSGAHRYAVVYDVSTKRVEQGVGDTIRQILYAGIGILIVSIIVTSWALNVLFVRPLRQVSRSADQISAGHYNQQIVSKNRDEIGSLARAVNKMAESLKGDIVKLRELDKLKSEFLMIASHNLRTPLTVMRGYLEMADDATTVDELKAIVRTIEESVTRLHLLAEDLLTISTLEAGAVSLTTTSVDARHFIDSVVDEFRLLAEKKQLRWQFDNDIPEATKLDVNQANVRSALGNVLDNAIKFTKEGGALTIRAGVAGDWLQISVTDTGIGIAAEELPKVFTMFHRGTGTLHYDYEGVGIGLYLTKLIIERHGGRVTVESQLGHGSVFTIFLPLAAKILSADAAPPAPAAHHHGA